MKKSLLISLPLIINQLNGDNKIAQHHLIIIGSGPAGLTAAIYAGRAKLKPLVIEGSTPSILTTVNDIENWPTHEKISGVELLESMTNHAKKTGTNFLADEVTEIKAKQRPFLIKTAGGHEYSADALIIATGMSAKKIGCSGEKEYFGKGVANCAHCDAPLFEGQTVVVVGGGMMALQNANILKKYAKKIILLNNKKSLSGPADMIKQVKQSPSITILHNHKITSINGDKDKIKTIEAIDQNNIKNSFEADGVFVSLGYEPCTKLVQNVLKTTHDGRIEASELCHTEIPGLFVAGNASTVPHGQAIICASSGCIAAIEAEKFLSEMPKMQSD